MKQSERAIAFLGAMLITFGITGIDFDQAAFSNNQKEYVVLILGIIAMVTFFVMRSRR